MGKFFLCKFDIRRFHIFRDPFHLCNARNRNNEWFLSQQPRKRKLCGGDIFLCRKRLQAVTKSNVVFQIFFIKPGIFRSLEEYTVHYIRKKTSGERTVRDKADAELLQRRKNLLLRLTPHHVISVGQAYGIVVLSRCLGAAWFAILIALLSILFRQTVLTTFSGIAVSILPHLIGGSFLKYVLPLPAGLLAGTGYVWGTLTEVGYDEDWNLIDIVTFPGITPEQFGFLIVLFLAIVCLLVWLSLSFYVGRRKTISARPLLTAVLILCMSVSLTGCGHSNSSEITHDFLADASKGENSAYTVELDMVENTITATSKATGEDVLLTRDPFGQSGAISSIYVDEDACYYASSGEVGDGFQIYRIDLKNFSTRLYFSTGSDNMATFWVLLDHEPTVDELLADVGSITSFVVDGNYIY